MPRKKRLSLRLLVILLGIFLGGQLFARPPLDPLVPVKIRGHVQVMSSPTQTGLYMWVRVTRGAEELSGLTITLKGQKAQEKEKGVYICQIPGYAPAPGTTIAVVFEGKSPSPIPQPEFPITAKATVGSLIKISEPLPGTHVPITTKPLLRVAWVGGTPPYHIHVFPYINPDTLGDAVYEKSDISGTQTGIPTAFFKPGIEYSLQVFATWAQFIFDKAVDPASDFKLDQSATTFIFAD